MSINLNMYPKKIILLILVLIILISSGCIKMKDNTSSKNIESITITNHAKQDGYTFTFYKNGSIKGGLWHGNPPSVREINKNIPKKDIEEIWKTASSIDKEVLKKETTIKSEWEGYNELSIKFKGKNSTKLFWPSQEKYPDQKVQELVDLLLKQDIW